MRCNRIISEIRREAVLGQYRICPNYNPGGNQIKVQRFGVRKTIYHKKRNVIAVNGYDIGPFRLDRTVALLTIKIHNNVSFGKVNLHIHILMLCRKMHFGVMCLGINIGLTFKKALNVLVLHIFD